MVKSAERRLKLADMSFLAMVQLPKCIDECICLIVGLRGIRRRHARDNCYLTIAKGEQRYTRGFDNVTSKTKRRSNMCKMSYFQGGEMDGRLRLSEM